jgi:hypothetical protein
MHQKTLEVYQEIENSRVIVVVYVQTDQNLTDPFIEGLSQKCDRKCIEGDGY